VIAESEEMLRRLVGEDIETSFDLAPDLGSVLADSGQIHQVLLNLVLNARDAMGAGGRLRVETCNVDVKAGRDGHKAPPGSYVLLSVADSGVGMDEATLDRIFEPFFTTKAKGAGTGLGLPTVHGIVRQNDGWITVESRVGQGTRMNIYLPRLQEDALAREVAPMVAEAAAGSETILVVEDEEALRRLAVDALSGQGYRVLEADGGQAGLDRARAHAGPIHLLLTDVVMPGMNGRELAERLRAQRPELRVLFMSGWAEEVIAHRGVLDQGVAFLAKPFSPVDLAARIRAVLGSAARG
jgi:CheY-like chemotaxis protein